MAEYIKIKESETFNLSKEEKLYYHDLFTRKIYDWYKQYFPKDIEHLSGVTLVIDNKFTKRYGSFRYPYRKENGKKTFLLDRGTKLLLSGKSIKICVLQNRLEDFFQEVIVHELIHLHLFYKGLPFNDGDPLFERYVKQFETTSSGRTKKQLRSSDISTIPTVKQAYTCQCPDKVFYYGKKISNLICSTCKGELNYSGKFLKIPN